MFCDARDHEIKHQTETVNFCLDQAEQDEDLTKKRHMKHMQMWNEFCSKHPGIKYLCVNGLELKQSIQVVDFLLNHYQSSLLCLNLAPFCSARLDLTEFSFTNLRYLTIERIDGDSLAEMLPKLPQLRGVYCSKSDFDEYTDVPDGVQLIVESYCNMEKLFFRSSNAAEDSGYDISCHDMLADAPIIVLNGGPVSSDSDLIEKRTQGATFIVDQEGIKFLGMEAYVKYGGMLRQQLLQFTNYMLEMVYDDAMEYLSKKCRSCSILRISNADFSTECFASLEKFPLILVFIHISLYYGGEKFSMDPVHDFLKRYLAHMRFQKFELFGKFSLSEQQQHLFFNLRKKYDVFVYLYSHQTCLWWLMDEVLEDTISVDGICVYRKASNYLQLDHEFVARLARRKESASSTTTRDQSSDTDLQEENYSADVVPTTDEDAAASADDQNSQADSSNRPNLIPILKEGPPPSKPRKQS